MANYNQTLWLSSWPSYSTLSGNLYFIISCVTKWYIWYSPIVSGKPSTAEEKHHGCQYWLQPPPATAYLYAYIHGWGFICSWLGDCHTNFQVCPSNSVSCPTNNTNLHKLQSYGITEIFLSIIDSYLSNRYQCVELNNTKSSLKQISIGVPQGSILGPLLFILFINGFPKVSTTFTSLLYADDTALLFEGRSADELQNMLDEELPKVCKWFQNNKLSLNTKKTFFQIYNNSKTDANININLDGSTIREAETVKHLGVYIDRDMKWTSHKTYCKHHK